MQVELVCEKFYIIVKKTISMHILNTFVKKKMKKGAIIKHF